ncbi:MAG TPA: hypothetical protein VFY69_01680 [Solirubrobacterales bacterium]|nr:hypothetical protein [Solirubrobacterales bacterium]
MEPKREVASFTVRGTPEKASQVREALRELYEKLDLPRPGEVEFGGDVGKWEQEGGWYLDLGNGDPWSQEGGWVLDLEGRIQKDRVRPPEAVLESVREVFERVKELEIEISGR